MQRYRGSLGRWEETSGSRRRSSSSTASREEVLLGIQKTWRLCNFGEEDEVRRDFLEGRLAQEALDRVRPLIIGAHLLAPIARQAIDSFAGHAAAVDVIADASVAQVHVRALEEIGAVLEYLLLAPARYEEFRWRWDNFKHLLAIRNNVRRNATLPAAMRDGWM